MKKFFTWVRQTLDMLCDRPDHLQRLAIIGSGMAIYPAIAFLIWVVWKGYDRTTELQSQSLGIMGIALFIMLALFGLVVVAMLGTVKGLRIDGPGGIGVELNTTADDPDVDPKTTRETGMGGGRRRGGYGDGGGGGFGIPGLGGGGGDRDYVAPAAGADAPAGKQDTQVTE